MSDVPDADAKIKVHTPQLGRPRRPIGTLAGWLLAALACAWLALCTAVGPLYWHGSSLAAFSWINAGYALFTFLIAMAIVILLVICGAGRMQGDSTDSARWHVAHGRFMQWLSRMRTILSERAAMLVPASWRPPLHRAGVHIRHVCGRAAHGIIRGTNSCPKLAAVLLIGWLWVPITLLSAYGADIHSQIREFSWAWNQWTGIPQPYIGFFTFVPMDIYPTAHYLWPSDAVYLTDQHNIVLTVCYGAVAAASRYFTDSNDLGLILLSALQWGFAIFCCAATMHRFFNLPWLHSMDFGTAAAAQEHTETSQGPMCSGNDNDTAANNRVGERTVPHGEPAGASARLLIILFFLLCPLSVFSTISLTKSPLFAFAFVWWFGIAYELHATRVATVKPRNRMEPPRRRTVAAFALATCVMLISAKYAFYILVVEFVMLLIADRRRWKVYVAALFLPAVLIHGGIDLLVARGVIIGGDPIESRGVQIQQIARVAKLDPGSIPPDARTAISRVFNLDQMAEAYFPQDADPAKSSGIQAKKVSYRWRTVSAQDMAAFDRAWLEIVRSNPTIATDAFLAKSYGYFNVTDKPYVSMAYYVSNYIIEWDAPVLQHWFGSWRSQIAGFADGWGDVPVIGWVTHGNLYVSLTLLVGAAEVILRRWRTVVWQLPLLLLMGVMITAPANNFERHMLPVAFVFGLVMLTFWRESHGSRLEA